MRGKNLPDCSTKFHNQNKIMLPILLALAFIALLFVIILAGQPTEFTVARSLKMAAPPEKVFPHVNDLHLWREWSPWAKLDPNAKNSFEGAASGVGAAMAWAGNNQVGIGTMTITESQPSHLVRMRLDFEKPMRATNLAKFTFQPEGGGTVVNWVMSGKSNLMMKSFGLFVNCDRLVGCQFEKGLANLAAVVR
jgi:uncharacterized protein YndB with AHSA1/START domain